MESCKKQPHYGLEPQRTRWCAAHAPPEAHDVVNRQCEAPGCKTRPHYGLQPRTNHMRWCRKHCPGDVTEFFTSSGKRVMGLSVQAAPQKKRAPGRLRAAKVAPAAKAETRSKAKTQSKGNAKAKAKAKTAAGAGKENAPPPSGARGGEATGPGPTGKKAGAGGGRGGTYGRGLVVNMDGHAPALALQALAGIAASIQAVAGS